MARMAEAVAPGLPNSDHGIHRGPAAAGSFAAKRCRLPFWNGWRSGVRGACRKQDTYGVPGITPERGTSLFVLPIGILKRPATDDLLILQP